MEDLIRRRIKEALGVEEPGPALRDRVLASLPPATEGDVSPRWQWVMGAVAVVVAAALVGSLVVVARGGFSSQAQSSGPTAQASISAPVGFSCRVPLVAEGAQEKYGLLSLPDGRFVFGAGTRQAQTYDSALSRWLPVPAASVSPDQRSYVWVQTMSPPPGEVGQTSVLHVKSVANGSDREVYRSDTYLNLVQWTAAGIYYMREPIPSKASPTPVAAELWLLDPSSGHVRRVAELKPDGPAYAPAFVAAIAGGAGWAVGNAAPPPPPLTQQSGAAAEPLYYGPDRLLRIDLTSGSQSVWYQVASGRTLSLLGFDASGRPVLLVAIAPAAKGGEPTDARLLVVTGSGKATQLAAADRMPFGGTSMVADSHGLWFSGQGGELWLYTARDGLRKVADLSRVFPAPAVPSPPPGVTIPPEKGAMIATVYVRVAGPCS